MTIDPAQLQDIVRVATKCSFNLLKELQSKAPDYTSRKVAKKKYKGLLELWEREGLIKGIPTEKGDHVVYPTHRLLELYEIYTTTI